MCGMSMNKFSLSIVDCLLAAMFLVFSFVFLFFCKFTSALWSHRQLRHVVRTEREENIFGPTGCFVRWSANVVHTNTCAAPGAKYVHVEGVLQPAEPDEKRNNPATASLLYYLGKCEKSNVECVVSNALCTSPFGARFGFSCAFCLLCKAAHVSVPKWWGSIQKKEKRRPKCIYDTLRLSKHFKFIMHEIQSFISSVVLSAFYVRRRLALPAVCSPPASCSRHLPWQRLFFGYV